MDVLLHDIAQEGSGHAKEKDGEAESPLGCALGETDVIGDLLAEDGPAVDSTYAAVEQQRRNGGANPFVVLHDVPRFLLCFFVQHISSGGRIRPEIYLSLSGKRYVFRVTFHDRSHTCFLAVCTAYGSRAGRLPCGRLRES